MSAISHPSSLRRALTSVPKRRGWLMRRTLVVADVVGLCSAFAAVEELLPEPRVGHWTTGTEFVLFVAMLPIWVLLADAQGLYKRDEERTGHSTADDLVGVLQLVTMGSWIFFVGAAVTGLAEPSVVKLAILWGAAILGVTLARATGRSICRRSSTYLQNTLIVGAGTVGQAIACKLHQHDEYGINVVGFVDDTPRVHDDRLPDLPLLGPLDRIDEIVKAFEVDRVVIAFTNDPPDRTISVIRSLRDHDLQIDVVPRLFEVVPPATDIFTVEGIPLIGLPPLRLSRRAAFLKRLLDVVGALLALVLLAPLLAAVAVAIKLDSRGPVFFRQLRVGRGGRTFRIFKFRTMVADAERLKSGLRHLNRHAGTDTRMFKIDGDPRVTRVGRLLRRYSLDELPQLLNVLLGEMSLVGPRPLIAEEAQHVRDWARKRLDLTPGITGLWQVLGRSAIPFEEMVRLDYAYVTTWSLLGDVQLLLRTIPVVARGATD